MSIRKLSREKQIAEAIADVVNESNRYYCPNCGNDRSAQPVKDWPTPYKDCTLCAAYLRATRRRRRETRKRLREHPLDVPTIAKALGIDLNE